MVAAPVIKHRAAAYQTTPGFPMKQRLYEVESFSPKMLKRMSSGPFEIDGTHYLLRDIFYIPMKPSDWERVRRFWEETDETSEASKHWLKESLGYIYMYSKRDSCLMAAGLFHSGYVGTLIDGDAQSTNMQVSSDRQREVFANFMEHSAPIIRSWYPMLPSSVDFYHLEKNFLVAQELARHFDDDAAGLSVLEVGAGGCLLSLFMQKLMNISAYTIIDLPLMVPLGTAMMNHFAPDKAVSLPNDTVADAWLRYQVADAPNVDPDTIDAAINITSFQEMTHDQIDRYFDLIGSALKRGGVFICVNRDVKLSVFLDYPWEKIGGEIIVDDLDPTSGFHRDNQVICRRVVRKS